MKKPDELIELLEHLKEEDLDSTVQLGNNPKAVVYIGEKSFNLGGKDCSALLNTPETVEQFAEALGDTSDMSFEFHNMDLEDDVIATLEEYFSTVDEV